MPRGNRTGDGTIPVIYWLEALGETRVYWGKPLVHLDLYQPAPGGPRAAVLV